MDMETCLLDRDDTAQCWGFPLDNEVGGGVIMNYALCSECGRQSNDWHWRNCRIQCRRCWELSNMPSYLRVQTYLPKGKSAEEE